MKKEGRRKRESKTKERSMSELDTVRAQCRRPVKTRTKESHKRVLYIITRKGEFSLLMHFYYCIVISSAYSVQALFSTSLLSGFLSSFAICYLGALAVLFCPSYHQPLFACACFGNSCIENMKSLGRGRDMTVPSSKEWG